MYKVSFFGLILISLLLIFSLYAVSKLLFYSDLSERLVSCNNNFVNTYLISYAAGPKIFSLNQQALAYSGLTQNIKFILNYNDKHLNPAFINKNKKILNLSFGAGAWLWKPYIILKTLKQIPENSLVIYADSGIMLIKNMNSLLELANAHQMVLVNYDNPEYGTLGNITYRSVLIKTNCDNVSCRKAPHIWAGFGIFKNTPTVRKFVAEWLKYCEYYDLLVQPTVDPKFPNYSECGGHQHDETILGIVNHKIQFGQALVSSKEIYCYIWNHHRHPKDDRYQLSSLLPKYFRLQKLIRWERWLYSSPVITKIRSVLFSETSLQNKEQ